MARGSALVLNVLALLVLAALVADNGVPDGEDFAIFVVLAAAPIASLFALLPRRPAPRPEADPREVLDFDDRLSALERAERRRTEAERRGLAVR